VLGLVTCHSAVAGAEEQTATAATPTPPGCVKDIECKGQRICVAGQCLDPTTSPAAPAPEKVTPTDRTLRTFGVGTGGGYAWLALAAVGNGASGSSTGSSVTYPPLELQFFNDKGGSFDLTLPVGSVIYAATNGGLTLGAALHYTPELGTGAVRGVVSPGFGLVYSSTGGVSAMLADVGLRLGIELLGADDHVGLRLMCEPALSLGAAWAGPGSSVGIVGASFGLVAVVSLYGTRAVPPTR